MQLYFKRYLFRDELFIANTRRRSISEIKKKGKKKINFTYPEGGF